jgi:hypothetical protein
MSDATGIVETMSGKLKTAVASLACRSDGRTKAQRKTNPNPNQILVFDRTKTATKSTPNPGESQKRVLVLAWFWPKPSQNQVKTNCWFELVSAPTTLTRH